MKIIENPGKREDGVLENIFVFIVVAASIITMGTLSVFVIQAQRYQAGLDLATHSAIRDLVGNNFVQSRAQLAQNDLTATFQSMGLNPGNTSVAVSDSGTRCGTVTVSESKVLNLFWNNLVAVRLTSNQSEPNDPLASGIGGTATCIGS